MKRGKRGRKSSPKQTLNLPDLDHAKSTVLKLTLEGISARVPPRDRRVRRLVLLRAEIVLQQNRRHSLPNSLGIRAQVMAGLRSGFLGAVLYDRPDDPLRYTDSPSLSCAANAPTRFRCGPYGGYGVLL